MINTDGSYQYSKIESVKMGQQKAFNVYPNPLSKNQKLVIESAHNEPFEVTIFDVNGKQIFYQKCENLINSLDNQSFVKGVYIYKIKTKVLNQTGKIVIE